LQFAALLVHVRNLNDKRPSVIRNDRGRARRNRPPETRTWSGPTGGVGLSVTVTFIVAVSFPELFTALTVYCPLLARLTGLMTSFVK